jgi:hypothetical protein
MDGVAWPSLVPVPQARSLPRPLARAAVEEPDSRAIEPADGVGLDRFAVGVAQLLLDNLVSQLAHTRGGLPARVGLYPGEEVAPMDECCAGQAAVRVYRIFPITGRFPQQNHGPLTCAAGQSYAMTCEMTVYRCAAVLQSNGEPPTVAALRENVVVQLDDAAAMRRAIRQTAQDLEFDPVSGSGMFVEDDYNPIGPAGDCVGGRQRTMLPVYDVPLATPPLPL